MSNAIHPALVTIRSGQTLASFLEDEGIRSLAAREHFTTTVNRMGNAAWDACKVTCEASEISFGDETVMRLLVSCDDCDLLQLAKGFRAMADSLEKAVLGNG